MKLLSKYINSYIVRRLRNHRNLSIARWSYICDIHFWAKMVSGSVFRSKGSSVVHASYYIEYLMWYVGWSVVSKYNLSTSAVYSPQVIYTYIYFSYRPPYCTIYITYNCRYTQLSDKVLCAIKCTVKSNQVINLSM